MMRFRTLIALAALTVIAAAPAHATGRHEMGLAGGLSMPTGDFGDAAGTGFNIGGQYQYMITNIGIGGELAYHSWGATDEANDATELAFGSGSEMSFNAWQYNAYGIWTMANPTTTPYLKIGAGWYSPGAKLESPSGSTKTTDTNFGLQFGAGMDWNMPSGSRFGIGANYHRLKDTNADFFTVHARVMWPLKMGL